MSNIQLASECLQSALEKVKLVHEYLDLCEYYQDGQMANLHAVILLLGEVEKELHSVGYFVPDEPLRAVNHAQ